MRYYFNVLSLRLTTVTRDWLLALGDYAFYVQGIYLELEHTLNSFMFQFFRKFLYADYCWFLFSSNTTQMLQRHL